jgi:Plasmid pRiA4b ORF-3-like protein
VTKRGHRVPNRSATRTGGGLRVIRDGDPPVVVQAAPEAADTLPELIAEVATSMIKGLAGARHPLAAELVLASMLGILGEGLPPELDDVERAAAISELLSGLIDYCERLASPEGLGFLRLASIQGPAPTRAAADEALHRLAERGVGDLRWAESVGAPTLLRAWRYGDVYGSQSSIGILFAYRHREHALCVLIDHGLGGGIKDAWIAEGRDARGLRDDVAATMAAEPTAIFEDPTGREALDGLRAALAAPPCPEQPDQIEDVAAHLYLVHARAQQLARLLAEPEVELFADTLQDDGLRAEADGAVREVLRLKVSLAWSKPPIWRRLEVPATMTLADLHHTIQTAFGWTDSHLHAFEIDAGGRRPRTLEGPLLNRAKLSSVLGAPGGRVDYVYDFGDNWVHTVVVEERLPAVDGEVYPRCTAGRRAGPPEDSGGVPGYERLLEILANPADPEHEELAEWAGPIDPARFDRAAVNAALKYLAR